MQRMFSRACESIGLAGLAVGLLAGHLAAPVSASPERQVPQPVTLSIAMPQPETLDPAQLSRFDPTTRDLVENLYVGLTRFDPYTHAIEPLLARSWSVSADGLTWTFELREDIQWVRVDPATQSIVAVRAVTAGDVVYAIQRACDPLRPSPVSTNLMIVRGCLTVASAFPEVVNDLFIAREIGARATGPHTLEIDLIFPAAFFPSLLSTPEFRPLAREASTDAADFTSASAIMTNGPYALQRWDTSGMRLVRNPHWPDSLISSIEQVDVLFTGDNLTATQAIASGQVDLARLAHDEVAVARDIAADRLRSSPGTSLTFLGFSFDRALVSQAEVRRALALSIDRAALQAQFFAERAEPAVQFTPGGVVAAPNTGSSLFDPAQAQAALSAAGYPDCAGVPEPIILLVPDDNPLWEEIGQFIVGQWTTYLGCNPALFEVRPIPRTLLIELAHANYDPEKVTRSHIWFATWNADYPDANAWTSDALHCRYGYVRTGRACDTADALFDRAAVEMDVAARAALYTQAEQALFGSAGTFPVVPLVVSNSAWLQQTWLENVNVTGAARFDRWSIDTAHRAP